MESIATRMLYSMFVSFLRRVSPSVLVNLQSSQASRPFIQAQGRRRRFGEHVLLFKQTGEGTNRHLNMAFLWKDTILSRGCFQGIRSWCNIQPHRSC